MSENHVGEKIFEHGMCALKKNYRRQLQFVDQKMNLPVQS